jgi:protein-S-isoprenylcysteine O-methyltransferase Ste14
MSDQPRGVVVQFGKRQFTGWAAAAVLAPLLLAILAWLVFRRPWRFNPLFWISGAGWLAFISYWNSAARNASATRKSESPESRRKHQLLLNLALLLLFVPVPGLTQHFLPPGLAPLGLALQAAFFLLAVWARRCLGAHWSGAVTIKVDHQLIRTGPYRLLRHPIYTAMLGMYAGTAIVSGELHALAGVAIVTCAYWRKIRLEEENLHEAFGAEYDAYRRQTWALLPGLF